MNDTDSVVPSDGDLTGIRLGDLQILQRLGRGGMADVYKATQLSLGRTVAVKVLRPSLADELGSQGYVERFQIEARAAARLNHSNIVQVYEVGQKAGLHYISQEFIDGLNLRQKLDRDGPLPVQLGIDVLHAVLTALDQAASAGITHRDIKPENIMLSHRDEVKVADFGLARVAQSDPSSNLTQIGLTVGTPLYMSPEQVQGGKVDPRSDLYSLGVTMFHVMSGRPPFDGESSLAIAVKQLHERPPSLGQCRAERLGKNDLPKWMIDIIHRLLAKRPEDRFASAAVVLEELHRHTGAPVTTPGQLYDSSPVHRLQALMRREARLQRRWPLVVLLLVACASLGGWFGSLRRPPSVSWNLRNEQQSVSKQPTVEAQYLSAMRMDTIQGWTSVWEYFPSTTPNSTNRHHEILARLQLARLYYRSGKNQNVVDVLQGVADDPQIGLPYRVIAHAWLYLAKETDRRQEASQHFEAARRLAANMDEQERNLFFRAPLPQQLPTRIIQR